MKTKTPNIDQLLQQLRQDKLTLKATTNAYKAKIKKQLSSPIALISAALGGLGLTYFAFRKKKPTTVEFDERVTETAAPQTSTQMVGLVTALATAVLPKIIERFSKQE